MSRITSEKGWVEAVEGRNIIRSAGVGKWTPEDVQDLIENIMKLSKPFAGKRWAYIADPTKMDPILSKETSAAFTQLHVKLDQAGCKAIAFLDGNTAAMKLQSQKHQNNADAKMEVLHFKSEAQALEWLKEMGI
jgi:hypothetical protein